MVDITYQVEIDTGLDGTFADSLDNITEATVNLQWNLGMGGPYEDVAGTSALTITLINVDGALDINRPAAAYYDAITPGMLVRVRMSYDGSTKTMWVGRITTLEPVIGKKTESATNIFMRIMAQDLTASLATHEFEPELLTDVRVDVALETVFESGAVSYPYEQYYWILGLSTLGESTRLHAYADLIDFEESIETIPYSGTVVERSRQSVTAMAFIQATVEQEGGGRFFWSRDGKFTFQNRRHDIELTVDLATNTKATLTGDDIDATSGRDGDDIANEITLTYHAKSVGTPGSVLFSSPSVPFEIKAGKDKQIRMRYHDPDNPDVRVSAQDVIDPVWGTDITTTAGTLVLDSIIGATSSTLTLTNDTASDIEVTKIQIRGTPLYEYNPDSIFLQDLDSIGRYGRKARNYETKIQKEELASELAQQRLNEFSTRKTRLRAVTVTAGRSAVTAAMVRDVSIGDLIRVNDSANSGHDARYIVVGESHSITGQSRQHTCQYTLRRFDKIAGWVLGINNFSELEETTWLVF